METDGNKKKSTDAEINYKVFKHICGNNKSLKEKKKKSSSFNEAWDSIQDIY